MDQQFRRFVMRFLDIYLATLIFLFLCDFFAFQREINKQRADFWATRTDGSTQMWQAIKSAAEALLANDAALANAIVEVSRMPFCFTNRS